MLSKLPYLASLVLLLILPLLPFRSHAQDLSDLPTCAESPALSAIGSTGCQSSDFKCLCKDNTFINNALAGAEKQCSQADLQKVIAFAQQICGSVGLSLSISATAAGSSIPSSPSSSPLPVTNAHTPTTPSPSHSSATISSNPSQTASSSRSTVAAAATATTSQGASSGAGGCWDAGFGSRGVLLSGAAVVVGWWLFGVGA